jgi:hypothetical protein
VTRERDRTAGGGSCRAAMRAIRPATNAAREGGSCRAAMRAIRPATNAAREGGPCRTARAGA